MKNKPPNLFERLLQKLGYVKVEKYNQLRTQYELMQKYDIKLLKMDYEIHTGRFVRLAYPEIEMNLFHEQNTKKFFEMIAPFIERRVQRSYPLKSHQQDCMRYELRLYVGIPQTTYKEAEKRAHADLALRQAEMVNNMLGIKNPR